MPNKLTQSEVVKRFRSVHKNKYDYSLVDYKKTNDLLKIVCPKHGIFEQTYAHHYSRGDGCPLCKYKKLSNNYALTKEEFILRAQSVHKDKYSYEKVKYINNKTKVEIICENHGYFWQTPHNHVHGKQGCPHCKQSKSEEKISNYLRNKKIDFVPEFYFNDLKDKTYLKFDFYIPSKNLLIEYNGEQHYKYCSIFHESIHSFHRQKHRDWLKREYCRKNNIKLLIISYRDDILQKLDEVL